MVGALVTPGMNSNAWRLEPDPVDQVLALEEVDDLQVLVRRRRHARDGDVVEHQLGVREVLAREPERVEDPVVARAVGAVVAAERLHVVAARREVRALVLGHRAVRRIPCRLVDDLQVVDVRVARRDGREPLLDLDELLVRGQVRHPRRLLVAPQQHVEVELEAVCLGEAVRLVERRPAHRRGARRAGRTAPLPGVLRRDLVEPLRERGSGELVHAPEPFVLSVQRESRTGSRICPGRTQRRAAPRPRRPARATLAR